MAMNCNGNCVENRNIVFFYAQIEQENEKIERKRVEREGVRILEKTFTYSPTKGNDMYTFTYCPSFCS